MDKRFIVTKSNYLINAKYKLSLDEQRIILIFVSMIQPNDDKFKKFRLSIKDFIRLLDIKDKSKYITLPKVTKNLLKKPLEINYLENNKKTKLQVNWFSSVKYQDGHIEINFSEELKPFLLGLKEFYTTYKLMNVLSLKSKYSVRLYEFIKENEFKKYVEVDIDDLKTLLDINDKYSRFYDIKRRIIIPCQKELMSKTDIRFSFEEVNTDKKRLRLFIYKNEENKMIEDKNKTFKYGLNDINNIVSRILQLTKNSINIKVACDLIENNGLEKINLYLDNYHKFKVNKHNPAGFIIEAITKDYPIPEEEINNYSSNKPIQSTNFDQREYDDEFYDSLYDNFKT